VLLVIIILMNNIYKNLPATPGVYLFKNAKGDILYIGKAANLKRRVSSYFLRSADSRIEKLVSEIKKIDYEKTESVLEALILESKLIKKYQPPFNIREKDDKSFLYVEITREKFPRVLLMRGREWKKPKQSYEAKPRIFGPFTSASSIREALKILRRIFPFNVHPPEKIGKFSRPCFDYEIGLCPGICISAISRKDYLKNIRNIKLIFQGKKSKVIKNLEQEMEKAGKNLEFEKAAKIKKQIFALKHIQDTALIREESGIMNYESGRSLRIEGYDVSNIFGTSAVGAMVVFTNVNRVKRQKRAAAANSRDAFEPAKNEYRKFRIRTIQKSDDVGMLKEVLHRRLAHWDWPLPDLILIDGGKGQVNAAKGVLEEAGFKIPIIGLAKGLKRKKNELVGIAPAWASQKTLISVRDEAHRFAISYHKKLRGRNFIE